MTTDHCVLCAGHALQDVVRLRPTPPANALAPTSAQARAATSFPLRLVRCAGCGLVQLADVVPRDMLFRDYKYATGAVPALVDHFHRLATDLVTRHSLAPGAFVVEIGSNDGTLLRAFAEQGAKVLGVDPALDLAAQAQRDGVPTLPAHFGEDVANAILADHGHPDLVLANNVLAHVADLNGTLRSIRTLLDTSSHAVFEVAHLLAMATDGTYEFVYHEHVSYFSLHTLRTAVIAHDMEITDVEEVPTQGGSLRCWVRRRAAVSRDAVSRRVQAMLDRETACGLTDGTALTDFAERVWRINSGVADVVHGLSALGRRICGYGASARAVTFMAQSGIGDQVSYIVDDNPRKVGWYVPGAAVPVVDSGRLSARESDYCVLFAWNFSSDILRTRAKFRAAGGRFIVPFPALTMV